MQLPPPANREGTRALTNRLAVFYALPSDMPYDPAVYQRLVEATLDVQAWYQCATGGLTWELEYPEVVRVYNAPAARDFYAGDWWGRLLGAMQASGLPVWSPGTVAAVWAQGAGWWAGAAQGCGTACGAALLGVELFPEFNNPAYSGGTCPGGSGGGAFPCTPLGAFAHELGHTIGLPHPLDVPETAPYAYHSVMQTHWNYPTFASPDESPWGFLTLERATIWSSVFMKGGISLVQTHTGCDVVNLPPNGAAPAAGFSYSANGTMVTFTNESGGATGFYWMFGDGAVSNQVSPTHQYGVVGDYTTTLRVSSAASMMDQSIEPVSLSAVSAPVGLAVAIPQLVVRPTPISRKALRAEGVSLSFSVSAAGRTTVEVFSVTGRRVRVVRDQWCREGNDTVSWDGTDDDGSQIVGGVYMIRVSTPQGQRYAKLVVTN